MTDFYNKEANMVRWGRKNPRRYSLLECLAFIFIVLLVIGWVAKHT